MLYSPEVPILARLEDYFEFQRTAGAGIDLVESDMRDFVRPGTFDLALSLFTSFGNLDTREEDLAVLVAFS